MFRPHCCRSRPRLPTHTTLSAARLPAIISGACACASSLQRGVSSSSAGRTVWTSAEWERDQRERDLPVICFRFKMAHTPVDMTQWRHLIKRDVRPARPLCAEVCADTERVTQTCQTPLFVYVDECVIHNRRLSDSVANNTIFFGLSFHAAVICQVMQKVWYRI